MARLSFQLPENLTIANVQVLHEELEALIEQKENDEIVLQADTVLRADTAGIQLLAVFANATKERSISLGWDKPSEALVSAVRVLGLDSALGIH